MTTSGVTNNCTDCSVDDQHVDITAPLDLHTVIANNAPVIGQQAAQVLDTDDVDQPRTVALPPDGGWGWVVVAAAFISNLIVGGVCYMFGIIMPELLHYFQAGKGKTAFVGSVVPGTMSIVGKSDPSICLSVTTSNIARHSPKLVLYQSSGTRL